MEKNKLKKIDIIVLIIGLFLMGSIIYSFFKEIINTIFNTHLNEIFQNIIIYGLTWLFILLLVHLKPFKKLNVKYSLWIAGILLFGMLILDAFKFFIDGKISKISKYIIELVLVMAYVFLIQQLPPLKGKLEKMIMEFNKSK